MNLKILFMLLVYYGVISLFFLVGGSVFTEDNGYNNTIALNDSELADSEIDSGGLFSSGVSVLRFAGFVGFGVGLPDDTPSWFSIIFMLWQTIFSIFAVGFIISSIWDG